VKGVRSDKYGFRAYVKVGTIQREKRFPPGTPAKDMQDWRRRTWAELDIVRGQRAPAGSVEHTIDRYLKLVATMPTIGQRTQHLELWADALGRHLPLTQITAERIREVLQGWRQTFGPATCNKRRTSLMHLFTVIGGKGGRNPVRDVPRFVVEDPLPRGRDPHEIDAALVTRKPSRMRASCRVLLWTGMRPAELQRAEPDDFDAKHKTVIVRTAKGGRTRVVPLTPQALAAWREFDDAETWGRVPQAAPMNRWLKKVTGKNLRVYDLRHSYGTALARGKTRLDVIGALMGHSTLELTRRYTLAAVTPDALAATGRLGRKTASGTASREGRNVSESDAASRAQTSKTA
jgi:integrase